MYCDVVESVASVRDYSASSVRRGEGVRGSRNRRARNPENVLVVGGINVVSANGDLGQSTAQGKTKQGCVRGLGEDP